MSKNQIFNLILAVLLAGSVVLGGYSGYQLYLIYSAESSIHGEVMIEEPIPETVTYREFSGDAEAFFVAEITDFQPSLTHSPGLGGSYYQDYYYRDLSADDLQDGYRYGVYVNNIFSSCVVKDFKMNTSVALNFRTVNNTSRIVTLHLDFSFYNNKMVMRLSLTTSPANYAYFIALIEQGLEIKLSRIESGITFEDLLVDPDPGEIGFILNLDMTHSPAGAELLPLGTSLVPYFGGSVTPSGYNYLNGVSYGTFATFISNLTMSGLMDGAISLYPGNNYNFDYLSYDNYYLLIFDNPGPQVRIKSGLGADIVADCTHMHGYYLIYLPNLGPSNAALYAAENKVVLGVVQA
jgi:hypothetical protein